MHDRWFVPDLRVTFLSVGEGDAAVVRFAGGRVMLIHAGSAWPDGFDFGERIVARYLWREKIMVSITWSLAIPTSTISAGWRSWRATSRRASSG